MAITEMVMFDRLTGHTGSAGPAVPPLYGGTSLPLDAHMLVIGDGDRT